MDATDLLQGEENIRARLATLETSGVVRIAPTPDIEQFSAFLVQVFLSEFPGQSPSRDTYHTPWRQRVNLGFTVNVLYKELRAHDKTLDVIGLVKDRLLGYQPFGVQQWADYEGGLWQSDGRFVAGRGDMAVWLYAMKFSCQVLQDMPTPFAS